MEANATQQRQQVVGWLGRFVGKSSTHTRTHSLEFGRTGWYSEAHRRSGFGIIGHHENPSSTHSPLPAPSATHARTYVAVAAVVMFTKSPVAAGFNNKVLVMTSVEFVS